MSWSAWANIAHDYYLCMCNVGSQSTNNFSHVVWICLDHHCTRKLPVEPWLTANLATFYENIVYKHCLLNIGLQILSTQYLNTSETTLHQKITCAVLTQNAQSLFHRKIKYAMLSWSAWANIAQENYLCHVGPKSKNIFAHENYLQFCLDLSGPTFY